jgi:hypothetical protein
MTDTIPVPPVPEPPATATTTTVTTSTNGAAKRFTIIGISLLGCIAIQGGIAGFCIWHPPEALGWTSVDGVQKGLASLALLLAGGLLGGTKPT